MKTVRSHFWNHWLKMGVFKSRRMIQKPFVNGLDTCLLFWNYWGDSWRVSQTGQSLNSRAGFVSPNPARESLGFGGDSILFRMGLSPTPVAFVTAPGQISRDKSVNCLYATVPFTVFPEPMGFVVLCQLAPETRPSMTFLSVSS
jgi:hypothetical protein